MKDGVVLHGNLVFDTVTVYSGKNEHTYTRPGGIANIAHALRRVNPTIPIILHAKVGLDYWGAEILSWLWNPKFKLHLANLIISPDTTSRANITIDAMAQSKAVEVSWGCCQTLDTLHVANTEPNWWHHIAYLDLLPNLTAEISRLRQQGNTVSADLAGGSTQTKLHQLSYLFASQEEAVLYDLHGVRTFLHSPTTIVDTGTDTQFTFDRDRRVIDPLGAGDIFAAVTINTLIHDEVPDWEKIQKQTLNLLHTKHA
jgi:sugar/nucleoside kinase (ribokinase family)